MRGDETPGAGGRETRGDAIDPATAFALAVKAIAEMITEIVRGQPAAERAKIWAWYVDDQERWRKLFGLDQPEKKPH